MRPSKRRIALIGECMIELNGAPFGTLRQTFGGDTLNTALYLARLVGDTVEVKYVSALGTDTLSDEFVRRWQAEGIDTSLVLRDPTRSPGLYWIQVDAHGERTFLYWRGESAARYLVQHPGFERIATELAAVDAIYLSGITLAILPEKDRARLVDVLTRLAAQGVMLVFDGNYRAALWPTMEAARTAVATLMPAARLIFSTFDDEQRLWGDDRPEGALARLHAAKARSIVLKLGAEGCLFSSGGTVTRITTTPVATVADTTAAGDAFNAGFLAARLMDYDHEQCCRIGNALAGVVIQHQGAIIPAAATPAFSELLER